MGHINRSYENLLWAIILFCVNIFPKTNIQYASRKSSWRLREEDTGSWTHIISTSSVKLAWPALIISTLNIHPH